jgi:type II secretory pathway pseudopilin PulG
MKRLSVRGIISLCCFAAFLLVAFVGIPLLLAGPDPSNTRVATFAVACYSSLIFTLVFGLSALFRRKPEARTSLVPEMVVSAFLALIVCAIGIPNLMSRHQASEASFISCLRTISSAQERYKSEYGVYGTLQQLYRTELIDSVLANATSGASPKSGYYFTMTVNGANSWSCIARPSKWGITGERNGMVNTQGVIYYNETENSSEFTKKLGE